MVAVGSHMNVPAVQRQLEVTAAPFAPSAQLCCYTAACMMLSYCLEKFLWLKIRLYKVSRKANEFCSIPGLVLFRWISLYQTWRRSNNGIVIKESVQIPKNLV